MFRHAAVAQEFDRWSCKASSVNYGDGGLSVTDVLRVHFLIVDMFYGKHEGLGGIGPKDLGLLESAVARQYSSYGDHVRWERVEDKAATLLFGIVKNHPFHDANKRSAFLSCLYLLRIHGLVLQIHEDKFEDFVVKIADGSLKTMKKYVDSFSAEDDGEIRYISFLLKTMTRQFDKKDIIITYRELDRILRRFDIGLFNPSGNYIDVCRIEDGIQAERICRIGYPGATKQVLRHNLKYVREQTGLDALHGVDSQAFFRDAEPVSSLMAKYYEPLVRLADR